MPVLAYCITEARSELAIPAAGVGSMPVKAVVAGPLQCFVSRFESGSMEETALGFRHASEEWVREWRQREAPSGLRCYALLMREHLEPFLTSMKEVRVSPGQTARVTGPWPATEFLKVNK